MQSIMTSPQALHQEVPASRLLTETKDTYGACALATCASVVGQPNWLHTTHVTQSPALWVLRFPNCPVFIVNRSSLDEMPTEEGFNAMRKQWYRNDTELFGFSVEVWKIGSLGPGEEYGPEHPGSKYTDYHYVLASNTFVAYLWDPDGEKQKLEVTALGVRDDGLSFEH